MSSFLYEIIARHDAGLSPKIIRKGRADDCSWCRALAGSYVYPDVPKDIYRRHEYCRCLMEYFPGDGRVQNVHTKKWVDPEQARKVEQRKNAGLPESNREKVAEIEYQKPRSGKKDKQRYPQIKVDWDKIKNRDGSFRKKFDNISDNEELNKNLYESAVKILEHRDGTLREDLYVFNKQTGKVKAVVTDEMRKEMVDLTDKQKEMINKTPDRYVFLHNHLKGYPPSNADFNVLLQRKQKEGYIICHDGRLYRYGIKDDFIEISEATHSAQVEKYLKRGYNQHKAQHGALEDLKENHGFYFEEV